MAVLTLDFHSQALKMNTNIAMLLPDASKRAARKFSDYRILYLLHGLSDDYTSWLRHTRVEDYATSYQTVVIMPSGGRSMYCDNVLGQNYLTYLTHELPEYIQWITAISMVRKNTYIAGNSMGGYGAARAALSHPQSYRGFASFSGLLDFAPFLTMITSELENDFMFMRDVIDHPETSVLNPINLLTAPSENEVEMYLSCGTTDSLLGCTQNFKQKADALGLSATCVLEPGCHDWGFWDQQLEKYLRSLHERD